MEETTLTDILNAITEVDTNVDALNTNITELETTLTTDLSAVTGAVNTVKEGITSLSGTVSSNHTALLEKIESDHTALIERIDTLETDVIKAITDFQTANIAALKAVEAAIKAFHTENANILGDIYNAQTGLPARGVTTFKVVRIYIGDVAAERTKSAEILANYLKDGYFVRNVLGQEKSYSRILLAKTEDSTSGDISGDTDNTDYEPTVEE